MMKIPKEIYEIIGMYEVADYFNYPQIAKVLHFS